MEPPGGCVVDVVVNLGTQPTGDVSLRSPSATGGARTAASRSAPANSQSVSATGPSGPPGDKGLSRQLGTEKHGTMGGLLREAGNWRSSEALEVRRQQSEQQSGVLHCGLAGGAERDRYERLVVQ